MKPTLFLSALAFAVLPLAVTAEEATPASEVKAAAAKLTEAGYAWKTTVNLPEGGPGQGRGGNRFRPSPTEGKINKEGFALIKQSRGDNTSETVIKNGKTLVKTNDGWKSREELRGQRRDDNANAGDGDRRRNNRGFGGGGAFGANLGRNFKAPAEQAVELAGKTTSLKKEGDTIKGDLTADAAKELLSFGGPRRDGREGPQIDDPRGSVTFWIKDGALAKYEVKVAGSVSFNGNTRSLDRTTTTEISDVGSVTIDLPEDAKKKLE